MSPICNRLEVIGSTPENDYKGLHLLPASFYPRKFSTCDPKDKHMWMV